MGASDQTVNPSARGRGSLRAWARAAGLGALVRDRPGIAEMVAALLVLLALGAAVFGTHVANGSFYYDDWANSADTAFPGHGGGLGGAIAHYWDITAYRPLLVVYVPLLHSILGQHEHWHLAYAVLVAVLMSAALYALLRELRLERLHAGLIAALVLVFPFSDATRLWATSSVAHVALGLYLVGLTVALRGLDAPTRRSAVIHHGIALAFYAASFALYELAATVILCSVLFYLWRGGWRRALPRFAADVVVVGALLVWNLTQSKIDQASSQSSAVDHAKTILDQGLQVLAQAALPFGTPRKATVLVVLAVVLGVGALVFWLLPRREVARGDLVRWIIVALGGIAFAGVAYAIFIPAAPYYSPLQAGVGNRVNAAAGLGLVVAAYGTLMVGATVAFHGVPRWRGWAAAAGALAALVIGVGYVHRVDSDETAWDAASKAQGSVIASLRRLVPHPRPNSTIYTLGHPAYEQPGVPIFASSWDLNGAVRDIYDDGSLHGYPAIAGTSFTCAPTALFPTGNGYGPAFGAPYGTVYLVDVASGRMARPANRRQCLAAVQAMTPGPLVAGA